jgi:hypothetical protein
MEARRRISTNPPVWAYQGRVLRPGHLKPNTVLVRLEDPKGGPSYGRGKPGGHLVVFTNQVTVAVGDQVWVAYIRAKARWSIIPPCFWAAPVVPEAPKTAWLVTATTKLGPGSPIYSQTVRVMAEGVPEAMDAARPVIARRFQEDGITGGFDIHQVVAS